MSVKVQIMQREFIVACTDEESAGVRAAAAYLDERMRAVSKGAQVLGVDRCAIMAGLNISHELLQLKKTAEQQAKTDGRIANITRKIDQVFAGRKQQVLDSPQPPNI